MKSTTLSSLDQSLATLPGGELLPFGSSLEHVLAEIGWVELLIRLELENLEQTSGPGALLKGLVISDQEVGELLNSAPGSPPFAATRVKSDTRGLLQATNDVRTRIDQRRQLSLVQGMDLRLATLARVCELTEFDAQCLVICLAVEIDRRYERLFAYLQDDVTSKHASADLVLNLLCQTLLEKIAQRERIAPGSPLIRHGLLSIVESSQSALSPMGRPLRMDERIIRYLLGSDVPDARIADFTKRRVPQAGLESVALPADLKSRLLEFAVHSGPRPRQLIYLKGFYGCGQQAVAEALCGELRHPLLFIDLEKLLDSAPGDVVSSFRLVAREAMIQAASVYLGGFEALLVEGKGAQRHALLQELKAVDGLIFVAGESAWYPREEWADCDFVSISLQRPEFTARIAFWEAELGADKLPEGILQEMANKFQLSGGQIQDAVRSARQLARWRDPASGLISVADLYEACRIHSSGKLATLGRKIKSQHQWDDLVLPDDRVLHLREICNCVKFRSLVFDAWGFDRKLSLGKGLNMLFTGPSGTGKTMAAEIMAGEVGLDVYKIDLSSIVSKYIGETEKNLSRIFVEAERSNAILFFDEADALFGKRSEVRDSHDRYANIEINYLLQKMEEHEGVVILATNFRKNMDDAFVRRLHFTVEFPLPDASDRRRIWERIWPVETPRAKDLDLDYMARTFEMPGGNIRNVAVSAAFLAASNGGTVTMKHLLHGTRREYQKMGRVVTHREFQ
jgi:SpoVK/Ycf46/Vps4 family AAA+-type ATPase